MDKIKDLFLTVSEHLKTLARGNAVVATPVSVGDRHIVPLCELSLAFGAGGGSGEATGKESGKGTGGSAGGAAKASPVAVLVVDNGKVRLETIN